MATYSTSVVAQLSAQSAAFRFVALLANEVSKGMIDLPAFPDVVARVKNALADENVSPAMIAKVVISEAGLAGRLMTLANSAIMNPSGTPITELKTAVVRIGYNNVRATSVAYAIAKLRQANDLKSIRGELEQLWKEATRTASLAHALARRVPRMNADEALLMGLVHNIGKVYMLSRSAKLVDAQFTLADLPILIRDWHANVGRAIVEAWKFAPHIAAAIGDHEDQDEGVRPPDLGDVLYVACALGPCVESDQYERDLPAGLVSSGPCERMGLNEIVLQQIVRDGVTALKELRTALGS